VLAINDEAVLRTAAIGVADACIEDADDRLARLLKEAIDECIAILAPVAAEERIPALV
jgi:hypothetical protein